jgi:hydroxyacylglutathione hydrolase
MRLAILNDMFLRQFFEPHLAQYSYLVGCGTTGNALVVDPTRHVGQYIQAADADGLKISAVTETHIHADFASGAATLARRTGATLYVSGAGGPQWQYACARRNGVRTLKHGERFHVGRIRIDALHTPGHTPEHLVFLVTDEASSPEPLGALTGDFLFVGDVGRPDLLEKAVGQAGSAEQSARQLFASLRAFSTRPDRLLLWPGHGAGSACGRRLGGLPATTLGYEKLTNWAFAVQDEATFVQAVLTDQPDPPRYFAEMKRLNVQSSPASTASDGERQVESDDLEELVTIHAEFVDVRADASDGFLPGSITIPLTQPFVTWAGCALRYGMPFYIVASDRQEASEAANLLRLIALDDVRGWITSAAVREYANAGGRLERLVNVEAGVALERQRQGYLLLDVRTYPEWNSGHIPEAVHAPLSRLVDDVRRFDRDTPLIVYCQAGVRSRIAATALRRIGFTRVTNLAGGYAAYAALDRERQASGRMIEAAS